MLKKKRAMTKDTIHQACKRGDLDRVKELVASGVRVNDEDKEGCAPLYYSVYDNHIDVVKYLLKVGADPNLVCNDKYKWPPLHVASHRGHLEVAVCLLDNSALVNLGDQNNDTPLHLAAHNGRAEIVEMLISQGADVNKANNCGRTPLYTACEWGHYNTANVLLQHGADPAVCDILGLSPLHADAYNGQKNTVQLLLQHPVQIVKDRNGRTPLDAAHSGMQKTYFETRIPDFKEIISMLERYDTEHVSKCDENEQDKIGNAKPTPESDTKGVEDQFQTPDSKIDIKEKGYEKTKKSGSDIDANKNAAGSKDFKNELVKEKTESCIIDPDIAENVLAANTRMREQEREVKRMFQGTEAENNLKDIYKEISNIGKEMKKTEATKSADDVLTDKHLMKIASKMEGQWKIIGGFLGVKNSEIKELASEHKTEPMYAAWCMLVAWRDSAEGSVRDKIQTLKGALLDVDREDIADML